MAVRWDTFGSVNSQPMIGLIPASLAAFANGTTPARESRSVIAIALWLNFDAHSIMSIGDDAPKCRECELAVCRFMNELDTRLLYYIFV